MPRDVNIPVLGYPSVSEAVAWLEQAFGFRRRWQIGEHRAQLATSPTSAIAVTEGEPLRGGSDHVMIRVDDVDAHRARPQAAGAEVSEASDHFFGERQYTAVDLAGRTWVFSQSIADLAPEGWGATT
jgi:uncharacterized glyoxalase superfamily protein PhnB